MEKLFTYSIKLGSLYIAKEKSVAILRLNKYISLKHDIVIKRFYMKRTSLLLNKSDQLLDKKLQSDIKPIEDWGEIVEKWYKKYQTFVGISEILEAQENVSLLTNQLMEIQSKRRRLQREVEEVHEQLLATHQRITKSELYSEDHYALFEKARQLNTCLKTLQAQFIQTEEEERNLFTQLSTAIKYCHEKERTQSEQSKYWSILISMISATLAALITSINNWVRIREIKDHASILHRDSLSKTEAIRQELTTWMQGKLPFDKGEEPLNQETILTLENVRSVVSAEVGKLTQVLGQDLKSTQTLSGESSSSPESQEVGYIGIACSMLSGAFLGVLITYNFFGSPGGGTG